MSKFIQNTDTKLTKGGALVIEMSSGSAAAGDIFGYLASSIPADPSMSPRQRVRAEREAIAAGHVIEVPKYLCVSVGNAFEFDGMLRQYAYVEAV